VSPKFPDTNTREMGEEHELFSVLVLVIVIGLCHSGGSFSKKTTAALPLFLHDRYTSSYTPSYGKD